MRPHSWPNIMGFMWRPESNLVGLGVILEVSYTAICLLLEVSYRAIYLTGEITLHIINFETEFLGLKSTDNSRFRGI